MIQIYFESPIVPLLKGLNYIFMEVAAKNHGITFKVLETGAKKIGPLFWAISGMKNGFTAFC